MSDVTDLIPVTPEEFAGELVPCLALVGGTGMALAARREWLNAAFRALDGIPIALLKRGAKAAMEKADHPSKIVPAIMAEVRDDWDWRRRYHAPRVAGDMPVPQRPSDEERLEVAGMIDDLLKKMGGSSRTDPDAA